MSEVSSESVVGNRAAWIEEHKVGWRLGPLSKHVKGRGVVQTGYELVLLLPLPIPPGDHEVISRATERYPRAVPAQTSRSKRDQGDLESTVTCSRLQAPHRRPIVWRSGSDTYASFAALHCFSCSGNPGDW